MNKRNSKKELILVFDCLRDPRDIAQIIHLSLATNTKAILTGNSLPINNNKTINILKSWVDFDNKKVTKLISFEQDYFTCLKKLKKKGFTLVGTIVKGKSLYNTDLSIGKHAIIFGTESSGLSKIKIEPLDYCVSVKMQNNTKFFTISAISPAITLEALRQKDLI